MKISINTEKQKLDQDIARVAELKSNLAETDYITLPDYDKDKPEILADRQAWRDEIRHLKPLITPEA